MVGNVWSLSTARDLQCCGGAPNHKQQHVQTAKWYHLGVILSHFELPDAK
eukprot:m.69068 g.69068  ORF g.69068 m.69068 type:complete len:50 (-) comp13949_c0_seq3:676-825(-)